MGCRFPVEAAMTLSCSAFFSLSILVRTSAQLTAESLKIFMISRSASPIPRRLSTSSNTRISVCRPLRKARVSRCPGADIGFRGFCITVAGQINQPDPAAEIKEIELAGAAQGLRGASVRRFVSALTSEDLPTFERPAKAISGPSMPGRWSILSPLPQTHTAG